MSIPEGQTPRGARRCPTTSPTAARARESHARGWRGLGWGFVVKLVLMALDQRLRHR